MTLDVQKRIESYKNILSSSLSNDYKVDWDSLKRKPDFPDNFIFDKISPSLEAILKEYKVPNYFNKHGYNNVKAGLTKL